MAFIAWQIFNEFRVNQNIGNDRDDEHELRLCVRVSLQLGPLSMRCTSRTLDGGDVYERMGVQATVEHVGCKPRDRHAGYVWQLPSIQSTVDAMADL